jgi:excisionase family DNA binding protein
MNAILTTRELAQLLKVSPYTVYTWARGGKLPVLRIGRRVLRFELDGVLRALRARGKRTEGPRDV